MWGTVYKGQVPSPQKVERLIHHKANEYNKQTLIWCHIKPRLLILLWQWYSRRVYIRKRKTSNNCTVQPGISVEGLATITIRIHFILQHSSLFECQILDTSHVLTKNLIAPLQVMKLWRITKFFEKHPLKKNNKQLINVRSFIQKTTNNYFLYF